MAERESTQAIARRVLGHEKDPSKAAAGFVTQLRTYQATELNTRWTVRLSCDLAELLRRAAAGECDPHE